MSDATVGVIIMGILGVIFCAILGWFVFKFTRPFSKEKW